MNPTTKTMPDADTCTVVADDPELPRGAAFNVEPGPVEAGQLAMIKVGRLLTIGRYYPDIAGADWIIQPELLIQITGNIPVRVVGPVALLR